MKLSSPVRTTLTFDDYVESLFRSGYKSIGSGSYAEVFAKRGSSTVIKVGLLGYGTSWADDGYVQFLKHLDETNPLFPKVVRAERYNFREDLNLPFDAENTGRYYVVELERLTEYYSLSNKRRIEVLANLGLESIYDLEDTSCFAGATVEVQRAHEILRKLWKRTNEDIHEGNVMFRKQARGKYQMVIVDPAT